MKKKTVRYTYNIIYISAKSTNTLIIYISELVLLLTAIGN